jgi:hypothetical protein
VIWEQNRQTNNGSPCSQSWRIAGHTAFAANNKSRVDALPLLKSASFQFDRHKRAGFHSKDDARKMSAVVMTDWQIHVMHRGQRSNCFSLARQLRRQEEPHPNKGESQSTFVCRSKHQTSPQTPCHNDAELLRTAHGRPASASPTAHTASLSVGISGSSFAAFLQHRQPRFGLCNTCEHSSSWFRAFGANSPKTFVQIDFRHLMRSRSIFIAFRRVF